MKFLLDNNLPPRLARALNELSKGSGHEVVALRDRFQPETEDASWIRHLGAEGGWSVVSGDLNIFKNPVELAAWRESKFTIFFLARGWSSLEYWVKASKLVHVWPTIQTHASTVRPGAAYVVHVNGKLEVIQSL